VSDDDVMRELREVEARWRKWSKVISPSFCVEDGPSLRDDIETIRRALAELERLREFSDAQDDMLGQVRVSRETLKADLARATRERDAARDACTKAHAACDELMTEFVSKKRAANWGVINEGMLACERQMAALRADAGEGRSNG